MSLIERALFAAHLLSAKRWEPARGFALDDEIRLLIAAQAALLGIGLDDDAFADVDTIIVHATTVRLRGERGTQAGRVVTGGSFAVDGQAHQRGPVLIAWNAAVRDARFPGRGHNVVFHEFAHKLDMLDDDVVDGTPPLHRREDGPRWHEVCTREFELLRSGEGWPLRDYGATDPGEFFAVATETFFDLPLQLEEAKPDLYEVLRDFYRQDPAARVRRRGTGG